MTSALRLPNNLSLNTSAISPASLRILPILGFVSRWFINTWRLWSLVRNFVCVTIISCDPRSSLYMRFLFKRLHVNTTILFKQSGGNLTLERKNTKASIHFKSTILWKLSSQPTTPQRKFIIKGITVVRKMTLVEGYQLSHMLFVANVIKRSI